MEQISPILNGKKYLIPISKYHPDVNHQRHLARRNERNLYRRTCDLTGESMISSIHPQQDCVVYNARDYQSDKRDPRDYGQEIDLNKSFTEQFGKLMRRIPHQALALGPTMKNCDFCNYGMESSHCYMSTSAIWSEHCYYATLPLKNYYDVDGFNNSSAQYCYNCVYTMNCYACQWAMYSHDCKYSSYVIDCKDCDYCFMCANINHQQYCIFNEQYDKKMYTSKIQALREQYSLEELSQQFHDFVLQYPKRATR